MDSFARCAKVKSIHYGLVLCGDYNLHIKNNKKSIEVLKDWPEFGFPVGLSVVDTILKGSKDLQAVSVCMAEE